MPPIMWLAVVVCVAGAVFLFRNQSAEVPLGIGENHTVVTAPDVESSLDQEITAAEEASPRSGDVDIDSQAPTLTPEQSDTKPVAEIAKPAATVAKKPVASKPKTTTTVAAIVPVERGPYVTQIGSFGDAANADKEAARLKGLGWNALVRVGNTSDGAIIYRVRIGYFNSRSDAETFIRQNRKQMRGAIAVHR